MIIMTGILPGETIYKAAGMAIAVARATGQVVEFQFNDRRVRVTNSSTIPQVERRYLGAKRHRRMKRQARSRWAALSGERRREAIEELEKRPSSLFQTYHR